MGARMVPATGRTTKTKKIFHMSLLVAKRLSILLQIYTFACIFCSRRGGGACFYWVACFYWDIYGNYYGNLLTKYKHDIKKTWQVINTICLTNDKTSISDNFIIESSPLMTKIRLLRDSVIRHSRLPTGNALWFCQNFLFFLFFRRQGFRMITFDRQAGPLQNFNRSHVMVIGRSVLFSDPARPPGGGVGRPKHPKTPPPPPEKFS